MGTGYKYVYAPHHPHTNTKGYFYEHILVAEEMVGHLLDHGEVVHHIDGNRKNNNPSNLMIFASNADHIAFHGGREIYEKDGLWYAKEKEVLPPKPRKYPFVSDEEIQQMIEDLVKYGGNFSKVSKKYNVTDNALRKRLRLRGLPSHSKDYKQ